jgi:hypothetical protein
MTSSKDARSSSLEECLSKLARGKLAYKARLADRLSVLSVAYGDDYEGQSLAPASVTAFVDFLEMGNAFRYPDITATPAGDIYAEWRGPDSRALTIEFLASGDVRYLILGPNPLHPSRTDRMTGFTTADALPATIGPLVQSTGLAA